MEQNYVKKDNRAKIGLILGIVSLLSWLSGFLVLGMGGRLEMMNVLLLIFTVIGVVGIVLSVLGFKAHKIKSILGIVFCLLGILPLIVIMNLILQLK